MTERLEQRGLEKIVRVGVIAGQDIGAAEQSRRGLSHEALKGSVERLSRDGVAIAAHTLKTLHRAERLHVYRLTMRTRLAVLLAIALSCAVGGCGGSGQRISANVESIVMQAGTYTAVGAKPGTMVCVYRGPGWRCGPCRDENHGRSACPSQQPLTLSVAHPATVQRIVNLLNQYKRAEGVVPGSCDLPSSPQGLITLRLRSPQGDTVALVTYFDTYPPGTPYHGDVAAYCEPMSLNVGAAGQIVLLSGDFSQTLGHLLGRPLP